MINSKLNLIYSWYENTLYILHFTLYIILEDTAEHNILLYLHSEYSEYCATNLIPVLCSFMPTLNKPRLNVAMQMRANCRQMSANVRNDSTNFTFCKCNVVVDVVVVTTTTLTASRSGGGGGGFAEWGNYEVQMFEKLETSNGDGYKSTFNSAFNR